MSGRDATEQLVALARREELIAVQLVARALGTSTRKLLRDWRSRHRRDHHHPETRVGRTIKLPADVVIATYLPHRQ